MSEATNETNQLPTINIKGKEYVLVKDRIAYFNEKYTNGAIETEIVSYENGHVIVKATVYPDGHGQDHQRFFVGHSQAKEGDGTVNKAAALENAETSAVGRALAMMGIGVIESVASADELRKAGFEGERSGYVTTTASTADREFDALRADVDDSLNASTDAAQWKCETCGAPADFHQGISKKNNKPYKRITCSTGDPEHTKWIND